MIMIIEMKTHEYTHKIEDANLKNEQQRQKIKTKETFFSRKKCKFKRQTNKQKYNFKQNKTRKWSFN